MPKEKIRVTIVDDHQSIVDGYRFRLHNFPRVEVVAAVSYGEDIEPTLKSHPTDVLLLDVNVPTSAENPNHYPVLHMVPSLLQQYPDIDILMISMHSERSLVRAVMEAGASGYIIKDDSQAIQELGSIILLVANGGVYLSERVRHNLFKSPEGDEEIALSARQREIISLSAAYPNNTTHELAEKMRVANSTVRNLLSGAYLKLGVNTRAAAIAKSRQMGIIPGDTADATLPISKKKEKSNQP